MGLRIPATLLLYILSFISVIVFFCNFNIFFYSAIYPCILCIVVKNYWWTVIRLYECTTYPTHGRRYFSTILTTQHIFAGHVGLKKQGSSSVNNSKLLSAPTSYSKFKFKMFFSAIKWQTENKNSQQKTMPKLFSSFFCQNYMKEFSLMKYIIWMIFFNVSSMLCNSMFVLTEIRWKIKLSLVCKCIVSQKALSNQHYHIYNILWCIII